MVCQTVKEEQGTCFPTELTWFALSPHKWLYGVMHSSITIERNIRVRASIQMFENI